MFSATSHSYALQVAALWASFAPALLMVLLIAGAQYERLRRAPKAVRIQPVRSMPMRRRYHE